MSLQSPFFGIQRESDAGNDDPQYAETGHSGPSHRKMRAGRAS
jgi:hypothetical protein